MIKQTALFSFICFLLSCQSQSDKSNLAGLNLSGLIKGDWIGSGQGQVHSNNKTTFICFDDSTCLTSLSMWKDDIQYEIRKDTLRINGQANTKAIQLIRYIILKLTTDSLVLRSATRPQDTLQFSKVRTKNNITPAAIYFASTGCNGTCPEMGLKIDSARNIRFYGGRHTSKTGSFSGRISQNEYNSIINEIRNLPVDSLQKYYGALYADDQTLGLVIDCGNRVIRSAAYGHGEEPMELHLLFTKLKNLYWHVDLQPDSSMVDENWPRVLPWFAENPPPPPPPIICPNKKFTPPPNK
jgi:hypothetical protein